MACLLQSRAAWQARRSYAVVGAGQAIDDIRVIEAVLRSAETGEPVKLEPRQRTRRPSLEQESKKRPVGKQDTVNAPSPSVK